MNIVGSALQALTVSKAKLKIVATGGGGGGGGGGLGDMMASAGKSALSAAAGAIGIAVDSDADDELTFKFNPTEYTITREARWGRPTTSSGETPGRVSYQGQTPQRLTLEIFFDEYEVIKGDVTKKVTKLLSWVRPPAGQTGAEPPMLAFEWGPNPVLAPDVFYGYLQSVTAKYLMFSVDGTPLRATANITLVENVPPASGQNPTSGSIAARKTYQLREGDSLHSVAYREYGVPSYWRSLAEFNGIDDPLRVTPGTTILLPSATEADRLA